VCACVREREVESARARACESERERERETHELIVVAEMTCHDFRVGSDKRLGDLKLLLSKGP
jgi:hypothetical protein